MLRRKALRKILITTLSCFILFVITAITNRVDDRYLDTNYEIIYTSSTVNHEIYLLGENHYLVKFNIFLNEDTTEKKIEKIISYLKEDTKEKLPAGLKGIIPKDCQILNISIKDDIATLNFSNGLFNTDISLEERLIEAIVYSVTALSDINKVVIQEDGVNVDKLPNSNKTLSMPLTKDFGINKVYDITSRNGIQKVIVYYLDRISNNNYYVPVTKYVNDSRDKIKIIIDNLSSSYIYEENLMSYLSSKTTLLDYSYQDDIFILNLTDEVFKNDKILEEVEYTLSHSIFDSYNVNKVLLKVNGEFISEFDR